MGYHVKVKQDAREIIRGLSLESVRMLAIILCEKWPHTPECKCINFSEPFDGGDGNQVRIVSSSGEHCSCGADDVLGEVFDHILEMEKRGKS